MSLPEVISLSLLAGVATYCVLRVLAPSTVTQAIDDERNGAAAVGALAVAGIVAIILG